MKAKHTEGPWEIDESDHPIIINGPLQEESETVCIISNNTDRAYNYSPEVSRSNARLIAAAPDMLEALKQLETAARNRDNTMGDPCRLIECKAALESAAKAARIVIAKAEGEKE